MPVVIKRKSDIPKPTKDLKGNWNPTIKERILRLRRNMLIHSYLYYSLDKPLVSDELWQRWANELVDLQNIHGTDFDYYDNDFEDWDGSTGYHLPSDSWICSKGKYLINICN